MNLFRLMGVEIQTATKEFAVKDQKFPAGSYIVRMDQPYSRMADMLLDTQYYNVNDPRPYDDTGWTLGALRNVKTVRITDKAVLEVPMVLLTSDARVRGKIAGSASTAGFIINHNADNTLATLRYKLKDVKMSAAEDSFKIGDQQFNAGSFMIKTEGNPADVRQRLEASVTELGLTAVAGDSLPDVETPEMAAAKKKDYVARYGRPNAAAGWHFLTGQPESINALTKVVGFQYQYVARSNQYAHATAIMVLTPQGRISRYFYGVDFPPKDLRMGLVEASRGKIGNAVDAVLLYCYHYNPETGKYGAMVSNILRLAAAATVLIMGIFLFIFWRLDLSVTKKTATKTRYAQ